MPAPRPPDPLPGWLRRLEHQPSVKMVRAGDTPCSGRHAPQPAQRWAPTGCMPHGSAPADAASALQTPIAMQHNALTEPAKCKRPQLGRAGQKRLAARGVASGRHAASAATPHPVGRPPLPAVEAHKEGWDRRKVRHPVWCVAEEADQEDRSQSALQVLLQLLRQGGRQNRQHHSEAGVLLSTPKPATHGFQRQTFVQAFESAKR